MNELTSVGSVTLIHLVALISPGPDFFLAVRNSIMYSRKTGIWTALGFGAGIAIHISYSLAGLSILISNSPIIYNGIKYCGALYIIYLGVNSFKVQPSKSEVESQKQTTDIPAFTAFRMGFLTNILNPKATLFFLSLFSLIIHPKTPFHIMGAICSILVLSTILWFSLVAMFMTQKKIQTIFLDFQSTFNRLLGLLLIAFGLKIALF